MAAARAAVGSVAAAKVAAGWAAARVAAARAAAGSVAAAKVAAGWAAAGLEAAAKVVAG